MTGGGRGPGRMRVPTRRHLLSLTAATAAVAAAAGLVPGRSQNKAQDGPRAVATFSILGDLVRDVGGERVGLTTLVGPNGGGHVYSPTPGHGTGLGAAARVVA